MTKQEKAKDSRLRREYQITLEEWNKVYEYQGRCCAICTRSKGTSGKPLLMATDHCHFFGNLRGILCVTCNKGLGIFRDNLDNMKNAVLYLEHNPVTEALGKEMLTAPGRVGSKKRNKLLAAFRAARTNNDNEVARPKKKSKQRNTRRTK